MDEVDREINLIRDLDLDFVPLTCSVMNSDVAVVRALLVKCAHKRQFQSASQMDYSPYRKVISHSIVVSDSHQMQGYGINARGMFYGNEEILLELLIAKADVPIVKSRVRGYVTFYFDHSYS